LNISETVILSGGWKCGDKIIASCIPLQKTPDYKLFPKRSQITTNSMTFSEDS